MVESFELAVVPELRSQVERIREAHGATWEEYEIALKEEFFDDDEDRVTKRSFLEWIEQQPGKGMTPNELLREFEMRYCQLSPSERLTLDLRKTELFLQAADEALEDKLLLLLADRDAEGGIATEWKKVEEAIALLTKQRRGKAKIAIPKATPEVPSTSAGSPSSNGERRGVGDKGEAQESLIDDLVKAMRELRVEFAELKRKQVPAPTTARKEFVRLCIWCDSPDHDRRDCKEFSDALRNRVVFFKDGKIHLTESGLQVGTNFGKGGMKRLVENGGVAEVRAFPIELHKSSRGQDAFEKVDTKYPMEVMVRGAEAFRQVTGWEDPVDVASVEAFVSLGKREAIVEEKRRRDPEEKPSEEAPKRRSTRRVDFDLPTDSSTSVGPSGPSTMEEDAVLKKGKAKATMEKSKGPSYKLVSEIENSTNLKEILEGRILDAKIEFTLKEALGIAKRDFHELIIDIIKRKRHMTAEAVAARVEEAKEDEDEDDEENVAYTFEARSEKEEEEADANPGFFSNPHWARATGETKVQLGELKEYVSALIDHGSEINIMSRAVYEKGKWPIDTDHGWVLRTANNTKGELYGACPAVKIRIGDVEEEQNFFVQNNSPYPLVLGQPFITSMRMETKVMDDGSHYARVRSRDGKRGTRESEKLPQGLDGFVLSKPNGARVDYLGRFKSVSNMSGREKRQLKKKVKQMRADGLLCGEEEISGVYEEESFDINVESLLSELSDHTKDVSVCVASREVYSEVSKFLCETGDVSPKERKNEALVNAKYKSVLKKVKPVAAPLPRDSWEKVELASSEPNLRDPREIGHKFTKETLEQLSIGGGEFLTFAEKELFKRMLAKHGRAFSFAPGEIGCVDPAVVSPMVIFTVPHVPWDLKPIPVPKALLPKLIELLKERIRMGILEPSMGPYSNRWFTVPKKSGALRFIQDMQPANKVTIRNMGSGPMVDEFAEAFAGRTIYSMGDLYSGYDQFQLAVKSRDITTMRTPLGLLRMCTLPQGATNSVAHMQNAMNKVLRDFVPEKTMPFLDDIPIKGCTVEEKDESLDERGCRRFVTDHIKDVEQILSRLEEVGLTLSGTKSVFGVPEVIVVGHLCGTFGRRPSPTRVDVIQRIRDCTSVTEVRRFLGACVFYRIWIPHYAHISEPMYELLRKGKRFRWETRQGEAMARLKHALVSSPTLRRIDYQCGRPVIVTVDTSPIAIGWAVGQDDGEGCRFATRFGARVLSSRQRDYPQVKRELWGVVTALKTERNYLIGAHVVLETDCLPLLGMIANCSTPDIAMLRWIAYIKTLNPELRHIAGKDNPVADMLSRARYMDEDDLVVKDDDEGSWGLSAGVTSLTKEEEDMQLFRKELYTGKLHDIGRYLSKLEKMEGWSEKHFKNIRHQAYKYLLKDGYLWKRPKRSDEVPLRVVDDQGTKEKVLKEFHDTLWVGHRGIWATYMKIKERYWWKGLYQDAVEFVGSCVECQMQSKIRHRDGLRPTYPLSMHFQWVLDLVIMPVGMWRMRYLVLAREELSNYVEGRALRTKTTEGVCRFILEDILCRYGSVGRLRADRGELDTVEARQFFDRYGVKLKLTTSYNPEGNGKSERGHPPIVQALVKACKGKPKRWPQLLPFALWADRTTHSTVTGYMLTELMLGQKPIMPMEDDIPTWAAIPWEDGVSREELLELRIRQLERRPEDVKVALDRLQAARVRNKERFDKTHRLRPKEIREGDWVLVYDSSLENQHSAERKFARRWFGPYVVVTVHDNATYSLRELDGTPLKLPIAGKRIKYFKKREADGDFDFSWRKEPDLLQQDDTHEYESWDEEEDE
ncbi:hypothetical protein R1sor_022905 [Riccia sorocarpa]|uniref:Integrase catalytic domain-containing protein n=1 Tax=Riccia sorocarpa TaxID=122646 RepID=A0ABD3GND5_9MARC